MGDNVGIKQDFISERERTALDRALSESPPTPGSALELATRFHEAYERLAPRFGYETKPETREFDPQTPNGRLMIAVCREIIEPNNPMRKTMSKEIKWKRREEWLCVRTSFCVVVKHWTEDCGFQDEGPHRWGVYAYLYPKHPLFAEFKTDDIWQPPAHDLPMHGGPSLFRRNWTNDGKECCSIEIGSDYHHDGDICYTHDDEGHGVKADAAELVRWLAECKPNTALTGLSC